MQKEEDDQCEGSQVVGFTNSRRESSNSSNGEHSAGDHEEQTGSKQDQTKDSLGSTERAPVEIEMVS